LRHLPDFNGRFVGADRGLPPEKLNGYKWLRSRVMAVQNQNLLVIAAAMGSRATFGTHPFSGRKRAILD
jgi:hypothetical protein